MTDLAIQKIIEREGGNFTPSEFLEDRHNMQPKIIKEFVRFRNWHDIQTQITSAYRPTGSHHFGIALDFLLWLDWRKSQPDILHMWRLVTSWPWLGVGIYFDWDNGVGFHVDLIRPPKRDRPLRWLRIGGEYYYQSLEDGEFYHESGDWTSLEQEIWKYENGMQ